MNILLYVLIAILIFCSLVFAAISIITENPKFCIITSVFLTLGFICISRLQSNKKEPSKQYQEKVEAVEKANKELEKFLIDYPEFREK